MEYLGGGHQKRAQNKARTLITLRNSEMEGSDQELPYQKQFLHSHHSVLVHEPKGVQRRPNTNGRRF